MKEYTFTQQYAIIGFNGLDSMHASMAKNAVIRGLPFAGVLTEYLLESQSPSPEVLGQELARCQKEVMKMGRKAAQTLETEAMSYLIREGAMETVPDILECDMNYDTAGVSIRSYRSDAAVYQGIVERIRAEVLEEGPLTDECVCLLWLMRETGCLHDHFTVAEQGRMEEKILNVITEKPLHKAVWTAEFRSVLESVAHGYLKLKKNLFKNPYQEGINLMYPFLDRRQAIFIDFVVLGTDVGDRRLAVMAYLTGKGHYVQEVKNGSETLLKIDNCYYRIFPMTRTCSRIPIQGADIIPVYR